MVNATLTIWAVFPFPHQRPEGYSPGRLREYGRYPGRFSRAGAQTLCRGIHRPGPVDGPAM